MKYLLLTLSLFICLILESTITALPLNFLVLFIFTVFWQDELVFVFAIISGCILDALLFRSVGVTSVFFVLFLGLVLLYRQKFEIHTIYFALTFCLIGSVCHFLLFGYTNLLVQLVLMVFLTTVVYFFTYFFLFKQKDGLTFL